MSYLPLLILVLVVYLIGRKFMEQAITLRSLLLLPVLSLYYSYINLQTLMLLSTLHAELAIVGAVVGLLPGLMIGFYRGKQARLRYDPLSRQILAKAPVASLLIWIGIFILRVGTIALSYMGIVHNLAPVGMLIAFVGSLFLGNVIGENVCLYWRSARVRSTSWQQAR